MRFIDVAFIVPPEGFADKVIAAQEDGDENIDKHSYIWRECKTSLKHASYDKCYYCEMKDIRSDGTVDHYRPKSKYKWAAYRFDNFRFACTFCNSRRTDQKTGEVGGKGADFPLFEGCVRATCPEESDNELPLLLDPCNAADPDALDYRTDGATVPKSEIETDPQRMRAVTSIEAYHLNHSDLQEARRQTAIEIQEKIIEAEASMKRFTNGDITARQAYSSAIRDLKRRLDQRAELSAFSKRVLQAYRNKPLVEQILAAA
ncbi:HNH endonuclease [Vreelandella alkaliphila]|uniref:HNH endonuclease n=1 Tax=Vreelandella alkaliphila TaxID=272774 RepID=UPI003FD84331